MMKSLKISQVGGGANSEYSSARVLHSLSGHLRFRGNCLVGSIGGWAISALRPNRDGDG
jgi:hypothetical protein